MATFEIADPYMTTWYFEVEADSKEEALEKFKRGDALPTHSMGGDTTETGKTEIKEAT